MPLNKIQIKAKVFEFLEPIRNLSAIDYFVVNSVLTNIKSLKEADFEFISKLLIKEADEKNPKPATAFLYIAERLIPDNFLNFVLDELNSKKVSDEKKMFLMNIMVGFGVNFQPEEIDSYLNNPSDAIDKETKRFMESAKVDPEALIDFLDFYFSSKNEEKSSLLNSVISDFEGDGLVNIVSTLMISSDDQETILYCLSVIEKSNSPLLIRPLKYLTLNKDEKIAQKASKILRKLLMKGLSNKKIKEFYQDLMKKFEPPVVRMSYPDGNSNFSMVISRKTKDDTYFLFFIAINLELGPFSCFGFSKITKFDHDSILNRFFNNSDQIYIDPYYAKTILSEYTMKRIILNKTIPYEYFAWEKIIDDILPKDIKTEEIYKEGLVKRELDISAINALNDSPYIENWFFRPSKNNKVFFNLISKVEKIKKENFSEIDVLIEKTLSNSEIKTSIKKRLLFLAFCLKQNKELNKADAFYSLIYNKKELSDFIRNILKRSIYEYFLNLRQFAIKTKGFFAIDDNNAQEFIDYIEENWVGR